MIFALTTKKGNVRKPGCQSAPASFTFANSRFGNQLICLGHRGGLDSNVVYT